MNNRSISTPLGTYHPKYYYLLIGVLFCFFNANGQVKKSRSSDAQIVSINNAGDKKNETDKPPVARKMEDGRF